MKRKILVLSFSALLFLNAFSQPSAEIGLAGGAVNYVGDLGNERCFPYSSVNQGYQLTIRNFLNNGQTGKQNKPFSMELRFSWHRLQYDETEAIGSKKGIHLRNYLRGIGFRNDLFGAAVNVTYTFYNKRFSSLHEQKICYFLLAGVGVYHGIPKADLFHGDAALANRYHYWSDGTVRDAAENTNVPANIIGKDGDYETNLQEWKTEGQGGSTELGQNKSYHTTNIGFPLGFGVRYGMSKKMTLSMEFDYYYFLTDYLDDVSDRYATYNELKSSFTDPEEYETAKYISDPSGVGTNGIIGKGTSIRGNPKKNDSYTYVSIEVAYKIGFKKKINWNNFSKH